jgi:hypothetical protein
MRDRGCRFVNTRSGMCRWSAFAQVLRTRRKVIEMGWTRVHRPPTWICGARTPATGAWRLPGADHRRRRRGRNGRRSLRRAHQVLVRQPAEINQALRKSPV